LIAPEVKDKGLKMRAQAVMPDIVELATQQEFLTENIDSLLQHTSMWAADLSV